MLFWINQTPIMYTYPRANDNLIFRKRTKGETDKMNSIYSGDSCSHVKSSTDLLLMIKSGLVTKLNIYPPSYRYIYYQPPQK